MKHIKNYSDLYESEAWQRFNEETEYGDNKYYVMICRQEITRGEIGDDLKIYYFRNQVAS